MTASAVRPLDRDEKSTARHEDLHRVWAALPKLLPIAAVILAIVSGLGLLLVHVLRNSPVQNFDNSVDRGFSQHRTPWLVRATFWITQGANTQTVMTIAAIMIVVLYLATKRWQSSLFIAATLLGEVGIFVIATFIVKRPRPEFQRLDPAPPTSSFPSGHTAASVSMYWGLAVVVWRTHRRRIARIALTTFLALLPFVVGFARMYRGMHFPTDVMGGMLLAALWLTATTWFLLPART